MSLLLLASIPLTPLLLGALLYYSARAEEWFLSPRALVLSTVRARHSTPEYAEAVVAREFAELLTRQERRRRERQRGRVRA
jgi:hypothetical protein